MRPSGPRPQGGAARPGDAARPPRPPRADRPGESGPIVRDADEAPRHAREGFDAPRPWDEDRPRPTRDDFDGPRPWEDEDAPASRERFAASSPREPFDGPRPPREPFDAPRPRPVGPPRGARPGSYGGYGGQRPGARPGPDRRGPRPYIPMRPAVAADPSLALAEDEELVAGRRPVEEAFVARRESKRIYVVPQRRQALEKLVLHATSLRIPVIEVEGGTLTAICGFDGHQGIALVVAPRRWAAPEEVLAVAASRAEAPLVLVLDSLEDPQNVGTLLRTAESSGVHGAIFPTRHQAPLTPAAVKASAGAVEHLALAPVDDLPGTLADLHASGLRIVGADGDAPLTAREADLRGPVAIVVGSEGKGLGPAIRRRCDLLVRIPMHGKIESLNA
ncbi:MAG: 23S rRNA (guanosine(2251)-2'-O)-methyltransferase RlmB, partial [Chloroflexota bacterium]